MADHLRIESKPLADDGSLGEDLDASATLPMHDASPAPRVRKKRTSRKRSCGPTSAVQRDQHGLPRPEPQVGEIAREGQAQSDDALLRREEMLAQVELLLIRGVTKPWRVAKLLGIHDATAKRYIEAIHVRWGTRGDGKRLAQLRGKARARLNLIAEELWTRYEQASSEAIKVAAIKQLIEVHDRMLLLDNLTPTTIARLARDSGSGSDVETLMREHEEMLALAKEFLRYVQANAETEPNI